MRRRISLKDNRARRESQIHKDLLCDFSHSPPPRRHSRSSSRTSRSSSRASRRSGGSHGRRNLPRRAPIASQSPSRQPDVEDAITAQALSQQSELDELRARLRDAEKALDLLRVELSAKQSECAALGQQLHDEAASQRRQRDELQAQLTEQANSVTAFEEHVELNALKLCREESKCEVLGGRLAYEASSRRMRGHACEDVQSKLSEAETRSALLEAECASLDSLLTAAETYKLANDSLQAPRCESEVGHPVDFEMLLHSSALEGGTAASLERRLVVELRRRAQAEAHVEALQKERDAIWEQLSTEEGKRVQVEAQAVAFEKEYDASRERLAAERLKRERAEEERDALTERLLDAAAGQQAAAAAVAAAQAAMAHASRETASARAIAEGSGLVEGLRESLRTEEARRREAETQVAVMKERVQDISEQLASMEAAELANQVVEKVLLQKVNLEHSSELRLSPGAGRIFLLEQMVCERTRAEQAEGRAMALEQRLVPVMQAAQQQIDAFRQDCFALQGKLEEEQRLHQDSAAQAQALREELLLLRPELEHEAKTLREDCLALRYQLEEEVRWREEAQAQAAEVERAAEQERESVAAAKRAAQRHVDAVREDSLALWGRLEAEQSHRQHDEAKAAAVERDARQLIKTFKEDCFVLESKVQAIETAAQRQVENFSDDCLVLRGRLQAEESRTEAEESRVASLSRAAKQAREQAESYEQGREVLGREVEELKQAAEQQMADFAEDSLAQEVRWRHEQLRSEDMQVRLEAMEVAAERQLASQSDDQAILHNELQAEQSQRHMLEQQLVAARLDASRAAERVQKEERQCASLQQQISTWRSDAGRAAERLDALHAERHAAKSCQASLEEQLAAAARQACRASEDAQVELQAEHSQRALLEEQLAACRLEVQARERSRAALERKLDNGRLEFFRNSENLQEQLQAEQRQQASLAEQLVAARGKLQRAAEELQARESHCLALERQLLDARVETSRVAEKMQAELEVRSACEQRSLGEVADVEAAKQSACLEIERLREDCREVRAALLEEESRRELQAAAEAEAAASLRHRCLDLQQSLAVKEHAACAAEFQAAEIQTQLACTEESVEEVVQRSVERYVIARTAQLSHEVKELEMLAFEEDERIVRDCRRIEALEEALSTQRNEQVESQQTVAALQLQLAARRSEFTGLQSELAVGEASVGLRVTELQSECKALKSELKSQRRVCRALETSAASPEASRALPSECQVPSVSDNQVAAFRQRLATSDALSASTMKIEIERQKQLILSAIDVHQRT